MPASMNGTPLQAGDRLSGRVHSSSGSGPGRPGGARSCPMMRTYPWRDSSVNTPFSSSAKMISLMMPHRRPLPTADLLLRRRRAHGVGGRSYHL